MMQRKKILLYIFIEKKYFSQQEAIFTYQIGRQIINRDDVRYHLRIPVVPIRLGCF
jgi:hypothetical protein